MTEPREFITRGHLGGYFVGGDPDTTYPDLWAWLVNECDVRTVLDVGCGDGSTLDAFDVLGAAAVGIDGVPQPRQDVIAFDFTTGPFSTAPQDAEPVYDLVWSAEFVEHVDEEYVPNFLSAFRLGRVLLMTHALPGQTGHHHVNCRDGLYWQATVEAAGFALDSELTRQTRALAAHGYYQRTGLAFRRVD